MSDPAFLFDANLWLALAFPRHPHHDRALMAFAMASPNRPAFFCRAVQQSFLRLASTPALLRIYGTTGLTNEDALTALNQFMGVSSVKYREEPSGIVPIWHRLARRPYASPKIWMDAYLAAFAISAKLKMVTFDGDFKMFEKDGLKLHVP